MNTIGGALALLDQEAQDQEAHGLEQALQGGSPVGRPGTPHPSLTPPFDFPTINSDRKIDPGTGLFLDELPLGPGWRTPLGQVQPGWQVSNHRGVYVQALPGFCECPVDQFHPALGVGVLRKVLPFETLDELEDEGRYFCQLCQRTRESTASSASAPPATSRPSIHIAKKTNKKIVFKPSAHTGIGE
uniref:Uncharacterized protein n=1 Tax=Chromera velia CCMP2878 TaxID=1169474 RepID=A0A0G4FJD1_9ALVE|eukprot:Cvel_17137.t1-p1 / transcript=Cvel_17137.t1 / gene=Cvel_17137 / organism=Chromera_velia_CCMP2878 / gene_product=hypothetical protein / transcript_product=hypothetical protein / location=Cvel_scaffold1352:48774-49331(-) / protein_length=186 / sequence_SO=supercontig / SO=protein_coding / is_pseudo=false